MRLTLSIFCLFACLTGFSQGIPFQVMQELQQAAVASGSPNVTSGLISWWKSDDASGSNVSDSMGVNPAVFRNDTTGSPVWTNGNINGALYFKQAAWFVDHATASMVISNFPWSITCWMKFASTSGSWQPAILYEFGDNNQISLWPNSSGNMTFELYKSPTDLIQATTNSFGDGNWHHYVFVRDRANLVMKIYVDGSSAAVDKADTAGALLDGLPTFQVGCYNSANYFTGTIDDVRYYNRALSESEVVTIYNWRP